MRLFQYAIIYVETDNDGNVTASNIIEQPTTVLAKDERAVTLKAAKNIPDDVNLDFVQVVVRPF